MRAYLLLAVLLICLHPVQAQRATPLPPSVTTITRATAIKTPSPADLTRYPRDLFDTAQPVTGATPFSDYDPARIDSLCNKQHELDLQLFDVINEAAVRHDPGIKSYLNLHRQDLGYIPRLAVAHYKWVFGDKSQLDWLMAQAEKYGLGGDSLILIVFGYMDEWNKTIRWLKRNDAYDENPRRHDAAGGETLSQAMEIRKRLYGVQRFQKAWDAVKIK